MMKKWIKIILETVASIVIFVGMFSVISCVKLMFSIPKDEFQACMMAGVFFSILTVSGIIILAKIMSEE